MHGVHAKISIVDFTRSHTDSLLWETQKFEQMKVAGGLEGRKYCEENTLKRLNTDRVANEITI